MERELIEMVMENFSGFAATAVMIIMLLISKKAKMQELIVKTDDGVTSGKVDNVAAILTNMAKERELDKKEIQNLKDAMVDMAKMEANAWLGSKITPESKTAMMEHYAHLKSVLFNEVSPEPEVMEPEDIEIEEEEEEVIAEEEDSYLDSLMKSVEDDSDEETEEA